LPPPTIDAQKIDRPSVQVHATMHAIVETQIAPDDQTPVHLKARQLMTQGLDRHEAIYAIASVLLGHLNDIVRNPEAVGDPNRHYYAALRRLNVRKWLRSD